MSCRACGKAFAAVGKEAECPACGQIMVEPEPVRGAEDVGVSGPGPAPSESDPMVELVARESAPAGANAPVQNPVRRPCPECGELIIASAAACRFCGAVFDRRVLGALTQGGQDFMGVFEAEPADYGSPAEIVKQIRFYFKATWASFAVSAALVVLGIAGVALAREFAGGIVAFILAAPVAVLVLVFYLFLIYKLWTTVQDERAATTPGKAIGFLFIPFFNLYWQFVALWGLAKDLNRHSREYRIDAPRANEGLALASCVVYCCSLIPYVGSLLSLVAFLLGIIALKGMCATAIAILQRADE
jgi:predicted RNA-binding Zn-ribbon protein involved in translation (DUF1610 family)